MRILLLPAAGLLVAAAAPSSLHVTGYANAGLTSSAAYVSVHNGGRSGDRLLGASSPAASSVTIHDSNGAGGMSRMRAAGPLALPPGKMIAMKPGGLHVMLMGLKAPLRPGSRLPLTLRFEKAGKVTVSLPVVPPGSGAPTEGHHGH
ncbi:copper chaperone PCu(A)C [Sphingomonas astaxanthinifaciens]|uniref:copper chaperone PCu(A)C n=1 Tax=Sphingomonas astaxanthinifaciens TaxID=407019 RepID=UPI0005622348|nr:copper chaperone PCu(A)C [Sphingomonas astaxanthinifaciens]